MPKSKPAPKKPAAAKPVAKRAAAKPRAAAVAAPVADGVRYRVLPEGVVLRLSDGAHIPADEANADFRAFAREVEADHTIVAH